MPKVTRLVRAEPQLLALQRRPPPCPLREPHWLGETRLLAK